MTSNFVIPALVLAIVVVGIGYFDSGLPGSARLAVLITTHPFAAIALAFPLFFGLLGYVDGGFAEAIRSFVVTLILAVVYGAMEAIFGRSREIWGGGSYGDSDGNNGWDGGCDGGD